MWDTDPNIKSYREADMHPKEVRDTILDRISNGDSLRAILRTDGMPSMSTVMRWLDSDPEFREQYARARELGMEAWAEDILDIADNATNDWMAANDGDNPGWRANGEAINRARLRVDSRKWLLSKMAPKKYGEKLELAGDPKNPLNINATHGLSPETLRLLDEVSARSGNPGPAAPVQD